MMTMHRVVELLHEGRKFRFDVDADPPLLFWRVETGRRTLWRTPLRVIGNEQPTFFEDLARRLDERSD